MSSLLAESLHDLGSTRDRVVVVADPAHALDLLRVAALRSDDVMLVAESVSSDARRFAGRFAVDVVERPFADTDLIDATALLVALPDLDSENRVVRTAWRSGVPVHVVDRPLVSDFTVLGLLEQAVRPQARWRDTGGLPVTRS